MKAKEAILINWKDVKSLAINKEGGVEITIKRKYGKNFPRDIFKMTKDVHNP